MSNAEPVTTIADGKVSVLPVHKTARGHFGVSILKDAMREIFIWASPVLNHDKKPTGQYVISYRVKDVGSQKYGEVIAFDPFADSGGLSATTAPTAFLQLTRSLFSSVGLGTSTISLAEFNEARDRGISVRFRAWQDMGEAGKANIVTSFVTKVDAKTKQEIKSTTGVASLTEVEAIRIMQRMARDYCGQHKDVKFIAPKKREEARVLGFQSPQPRPAG